MSTSAFNLTDDVPLPAESPPCSGRWERLELVMRKLDAQAHYASTSSVLVRARRRFAELGKLGHARAAEPLPHSAGANIESTAERGQALSRTRARRASRRRRRARRASRRASRRMSRPTPRRALPSGPPPSQRKTTTCSTSTGTATTPRRRSRATRPRLRSRARARAPASRVARNEECQ